MGAERLNALSAAFLTAEEVDPGTSMVIGSLGVLDGPAPTVDDVRAVIESRLHLAPRYTQRPRRSRLGLRAPAWVEDPDFDITDHVTGLALPSPGNDQQLTELMAWVMGGRMDRGHPLWDVALVDGLEGGRWALICRLHHALADGMSGTALMGMLYDASLEEVPALPPPEAHPLLRRAAEATSAVRGSVALGAALTSLHGSGLNGPLGGSRGYAWSQVSLSSSAHARRCFHATVNDLALASVAGGFRELLLARGLTPDSKSLRSLVPVSSWRSSALAGPDNQVTLMLTMLPVELEDPVARVEAVHDRIAALRRSGEPAAGVQLQSLAAWTPYPLVELATRVGLTLPQRQVNAVTTNVPGPRRPLHCLGRTVRDLLPYVPIAARVRFGVAMFSYCDTLTFGVTSDLDHAPDGGLLAAAAASAWDDLIDIAAGRGEPRTDVHHGGDLRP